MRNTPIYISAGLHIGLLIAFTISWPWLKRDFVIPPPISIEFVEVDKITQTDKVTPKPVPKEEKKEEEPKPPPPPVNTASEMATPVPKQEVKKEENQPEIKKEKAVEDPDKLPEKKKVPEKKKEEPKKEAPPKKDFASVLKNLADEKNPAPPSDVKDMKAKETAAAEGQNAPLGQKMTMSEEDALRRQLEGCWNVPFGAKDAEITSVEIFMVINPDRTLREAKIVDMSRYNSDTFFRALADSALRAVRNPLCSPFQLPPDKYDLWKTTTVNFNPSQMF